MATVLPEDRAVWFNVVEPISGASDPDSGFVDKKTIDKKYAAAEKLFNEQVLAVTKQKKGNTTKPHTRVTPANNVPPGRLTGDDRMLQTMLRSGTLADKVAAMTLAIQVVPLEIPPKASN
jgi:hypothetical protein